MRDENKTPVFRWVWYSHSLQSYIWEECLDLNGVTTIIRAARIGLYAVY